MALSKKIKNNPPEELPDLAIDELKKDLKNVQGEKEEETPAEVPAQQEEQTTPPESETVQEEQPSESTEEENTAENSPENSGEKTEESEDNYQIDPNKSFFNSLLTDLENKETDISKLNEWYKTKFPQGNALEEMKEYWKEKKDEIILENIGKELKTRIDSHMKQLQKLEGEWQKIYFDLISKEDEMKNQEKKLKEVISEFTEVFKKRGNIKKDKKARIINEKKEKNG
jgi:hypothetical protein